MRLAVWVPYVANTFKDAKHYCGNCGTELVNVARTGGTQVLVGLWADSCGALTVVYPQRDSH